MQALIAFAKVLEDTPWGAGVRNSLWAYPYTQMIHFGGLSLWLGTNFALDLRLLGIGRRDATAAKVADDLFAWNWIAFCIVLLGGFLLFCSNAAAFVQNPAFEWKLGLFVPLALIFHIVVQRKARVWGKTMDLPASARLAGLAEILMWICVVTAAVMIPNY